MHSSLLTELKAHIQKILRFVEAPSEKNTYKYHDLISDQKTEFKELKGFPCEYFLFLGNKHLCRKFVKDGQTFTDKSTLDYSLTSYIQNLNQNWDGFTGDHCYPIPARPYLPLDTYNAGLTHIHRKAEGTLWLKDMGMMRISYLKYLLSEIELTLQGTTHG